MAAPIAAQKLKHGKALCKAVFGRFVDTFNWLVDFCSSLKGDRDVNPAGDGRITVDRSDPSAPVIRCSGCGNGNGGDRRPKLWSFHSSESEGEGGESGRSGGWYNCRLQVGYTTFLDDALITGRDLCDDGTYYVEVNVKAETAEIKKAADGEGVPPMDIVNSLVRIPIGRIADGVLATPPLDLVPVVYKYA